MRLSVGRIRNLIEQITQETLIKYNLVPAVNGGAELGTSAKRYANIYCQDLNLANERGDYTVIEEEDYLGLRNNKTNKLYKFVLEEVEAESDSAEGK